MKLTKITITKYLMALLVCIIFISLSCSATIADDKEDAMSTLYLFYQSSIMNNLDLYMQVQDPLFLKLLEQDGENPRELYQTIFDEVDMTSFSIENPEIILREEDPSATIYYRLKGTYVLDGKKEKLDNDMVAFLWKYDDWKVRWTMTRTLYEDKIALNLLMDLTIQEAIYEADNITLQETFIQEGIPFELEPVVFEEEKEFSFQKIINFFLVLVAIIIIAGLGFLVFQNRKKIIKSDVHKKTGKFAVKSSKIIIKYSKKIIKLIIIISKIIIKLIMKYSKKSILFIIKIINDLVEEKKRKKIMKRKELKK